MNLIDFEKKFAELGNDYKTKDLDKFNKALIKKREDVSFLKKYVLSKQQYHRTYFQVSLGIKGTIEEQFKFIEDNFNELNDWWHVDQLTQFLKKDLSFDFAYKKAKEYIENDLTFARRWGYVLFMPTLVKDTKKNQKIFDLFKDDDEYYVQMAEAWLISYLAIYSPDETLKYLENCDLNYNIVGKAIQKICDSFRISDDYKEKFKEIRKKYKKK